MHRTRLGLFLITLWILELVPLLLKVLKLNHMEFADASNPLTAGIRAMLTTLLLIGWVRFQEKRRFFRAGIYLTFVYALFLALFLVIGFGVSPAESSGMSGVWFLLWCFTNLSWVSQIVASWSGGTMWLLVVNVIGSLAFYVVLGEIFQRFVLSPVVRAER